jgi:hypothetical protein
VKNVRYHIAVAKNVKVGVSILKGKSEKAKAISFPAFHSKQKPGLGSCYLVFIIFPHKAPNNKYQDPNVIHSISEIVFSTVILFAF